MSEQRKGEEFDFRALEAPLRENHQIINTFIRDYLRHPYRGDGARPMARLNFAMVPKIESDNQRIGSGEANAQLSQQERQKLVEVLREDYNATERVAFEQGEQLHVAYDLRRGEIPFMLIETYVHDPAEDTLRLSHATVAKAQYLSQTGAA